MAWVPALMAAAPLLIGALQDKPDAPQRRQSPGAIIPDQSEMFADLLREARDPSRRGYRAASDAAMSAVDRSLAKRGLANSSLALQTQSGIQADMANKFANQAFDKEVAVRNAQMQHERARAQQQAGFDDAQYQNDIAQFQNQQANQAADMAAWGRLGQIGATAYGDYRTEQAGLSRRDADQLNMNRYLGVMEANAGIVPGNVYGQPLDQPSFGVSPHRAPAYTGYARGF